MASMIKTSKISLLICLPLVNIGCKVLSGDEILRLENLGSDRWCVVEKNLSPNRSQTQTIEAVALFFTGKGNYLNAWARSAWSRINLIRLGLLGFDRGVGFVGLQFKGLGFVGLGIMRLWILLILIFEWSCCLALRPREMFSVCERWENNELDLQFLQLKKGKIFLFVFHFF